MSTADDIQLIQITLEVTASLEDAFSGFVINSTNGGLQSTPGFAMYWILFQMSPDRVGVVMSRAVEDSTATGNRDHMGIPGQY